MTLTTKQEKLRFWRNWTLLNALGIILVYPIGLLIALMITEFMGYTISEWPSHFEQTTMLIVFGILMGFVIGFIQWRLLRRVINVSSLWMYSVVIGFVSFEIIAGIILWKLEINRGDLSFFERNSLPHALILAISGLLIGLIQLPLLRNYYSKTAYWVLASSLAWGISVLITAVAQNNEIALLIAFILGSLLYGAITGATLMWVLKNRE